MKIIIFIFCVLSGLYFWFSNTYASWCQYDDNASISEFLNDCKPKKVVGWNEQYNMEIERWFKDIINDWAKNLALILWVWAVGSLVYAWLLLQFNGWEDQNTEKAKNIIKWTLIGFGWMISISAFIYIIINVMFGLWW